MLRLTEEKLPLDHPPEALSAAVAARLGVPSSRILDIIISRRGYDARKKNDIQLVYTLDVAVTDEDALLAALPDAARIMPTPDNRYQPPPATHIHEAGRPLVVGSGPCGLFTALILAEAGYRPILLERGKPVRERARDTWRLWREGLLDPISNVQFGEGGAGTFSDGKLSSHIRDPRHLGQKVLETFVATGAPEEILFVAKPHIGTFRLVKMLENFRARLLSLGVEIRFGAQVDHVMIETDSRGRRRMTGVHLASGETLTGSLVALAIGHSARDTFQMLHDEGVAMAAKPFAIGVRIEHPQRLIDEAQFGRFAGHPLLGAADYKLTCRTAHGRSVYSFCMCPGGQVVAAASETGGVVTNGMSQYSRAERNANSALVVDVMPGRDFPDQPLAGISFQQTWERRAFVAGGGAYQAPAQLLGDFLRGAPSCQLGEVLPSYQPGIRLGNLADCLPDAVAMAIRDAIPVFARKIRGFDREDALLTGVETRTSSPLRILRDHETLESVNTRGLFPAGEGAGYAGGILSAAVDGIRVAEAMIQAANTD
jgi:uncharacterized FAD-dependent dehydrogenase